VLDGRPERGQLCAQPTLDERGRARPQRARRDEQAAIDGLHPIRGPPRADLVTGLQPTGAELSPCPTGGGTFAPPEDGFGSIAAIGPDQGERVQGGHVGVGRDRQRSALDQDDGVTGPIEEVEEELDAPNGSGGVPRSGAGAERVGGAVVLTGGDEVLGVVSVVGQAQSAERDRVP
jgi:hypothetical protein